MMALAQDGSAGSTASPTPTQGTEHILTHPTATTRLLTLSAEHIESLVSVEDAIETQHHAFTALARGDALLAPRLLIPGHEESFGFVYAARNSVDADLVIKAGSMVPANLARGLGTISAIVLVLDSVTGQPKALLDGTAVTDLRTVAASAAVARTLCPTPETVAIIGFGPQGQAHARVLSQVLQPAQLKIWARSATAAGVQSLNIPGASLSRSPSEAVADADLVVLCTTSRKPVVELGWLKPTATVLSLGSIAADRREVGSDIVQAARLLVDDIDTAMVQAGPIVRELRAKTIVRADLEAIGDVMLRVDAGDPLPPRLTYYNSGGIGIQDAAVTALILDRAEKAGLGETVEL